MRIAPRVGLHAIVDGREYPLERAQGGGWEIWTPATAEAPPTGWGRSGSVFARPVTATDVDGVIRIDYEGEYRGVPVQLSPNFAGGFELWSSHVEDAVRVGLTQNEATRVHDAVAADDPDLVYRQTREPVPFPTVPAA
jgi:hypothetical protein